ncbi:hypothetical protein IMZ31_19415 (plasmid) [Pontibacillus sp. ALD_SL1]|uniref:hypothetical protein n=1 Tax=Pontibacillus sp. ALD_SL1 TaxID=2777185 RepID=UPI001A9768DB|nr:hypothetical protein [Pontibacillus sp. ALD_SL1]QST02720.1 hypothetical protein IMZ31_19415 [Pontibacillus sp. ALD_SL1]
MIKKGDCLLLGGSRFVVLRTEADKAFVAHISDPFGKRAKWILISLLPVPFGNISVPEEKKRHDSESRG